MESITKLKCCSEPELDGCMYAPLLIKALENRNQELVDLLNVFGNRRYPGRCYECGEQALQLDTIHDYTTKCKKDDVLHDVTVKELSVLKCQKCGALLFGNQAIVQIQAQFEVVLLQKENAVLLNRIKDDEEWEKALETRIDSCRDLRQELQAENAKLTKQLAELAAFNKKVDGYVQAD